MQHDEFPDDHQEYIPDPSIKEEGPWHVYYEKGVARGIGSHDFTYDVMFGLAGDFYDEEQRARYANEIVSRLNAYGDTVKPDNQVETYEALRHLTDVLDNMKDAGELNVPPALAEALENARWAVMCRADSRRRYQLKKIHETVDEIAKKLGVGSLSKENLQDLGVADETLLEQVLEALTEKF